MTKVEELQQRVVELERALARMGIPVPGQAAMQPEIRADYIGPGTPEHMIFLGLEEIRTPEEGQGRIVYKSLATQRSYALVDELGTFARYPNPTQAAQVVLRQKVSEFESGPGTIAADVPPPWKPVDLV